MPQIDKYYCYACEIQFNKNFTNSEEIKCIECGSGAIEKLTNTIGLDDQPEPEPEYVPPPRTRTNNDGPNLLNQSRNPRLIFGGMHPLAALARTNNTSAAGARNAANAAVNAVNASAANAAAPATNTATNTALPPNAPPGFARMLDFLNQGSNTTITESNPTQGLSIQHITTTGAANNSSTSDQNNDGLQASNHVITITMDPTANTPQDVFAAIRNQLSSVIGPGAFTGEMSIGQNMGNYAVGNMESIITRLMEEGQGGNRRPASEAIIASIPSQELGQRAFNKLKEDNNTDCAICMAPFTPTTIIKKLECNHIFHCDCIDAWLREQSNCPVCRAPVSRPRVDLEGGAAGNSAGPHENARPERLRPNLPGMNGGLADAIGDLLGNLENLVQGGMPGGGAGTDADRRASQTGQAAADQTESTETAENTENTAPVPSNEATQSTNPTSSTENNESSNSTENVRARPRRDRSPSPPSYFS